MVMHFSLILSIVNVNIKAEVMNSFILPINLSYLFVNRHEVHSMNTHTLQNACR